MRIGLLGPAGGDRQALREALEFALGDVGVEQAIYLGDDEEEIDDALREWANELFGGEPSESAFLERAAALAADGSPDEIDRLLVAEAAVQRLGRVRKLPPAPARAVEMLSDRFIIAVHDKSILDEEDIANAQIIVYGKSGEAQLRRFGSRYFLTPGPLTDGKVAVLDVEEDGQISIALFDTSGLPVWRETMARRTSKVKLAQ